MRFRCNSKLQIQFPVLSICKKSRQIIEKDVKTGYKKLTELLSPHLTSQYYRFHDHWKFVTQRMAFLVALIVYLETGTLVTRDTVAETLGGNF